MPDAGDDPRGALVRPYTVTHGRTEPRAQIALEAVLMTTSVGRYEGRSAGRDKSVITSLCDGRPQSLAEIAAYVRFPLGVTRVLVADMVADGLLSLYEPTDMNNVEARMALLERVLSGLRNL